MRIQNRDSSTTLLIDNQQPSLSIDVLIDARDSSNTEIQMILSIHHLDSDTLDNWLVDFDDDKMKLPIITSDGIRMLDYELEEDLSPLLQGIPIEGISEGFSDLFGTEIIFSSRPLPPQMILED
jgi:hypothetical protein